MIELTDQQQKDLAAEGNGIPHVLNPCTKEAFVLLPIHVYERIREMLENDGEQKIILNYSMKQATAVAKENPY